MCRDTAGTMSSTLSHAANRARHTSSEVGNSRRSSSGIAALTWLEGLTNPTMNPDGIAERERCSARQVNMMISLAFLAPDLVKAAIEGKLPHGMGVRRLRDMPAEWSRQRQTLGL